MSGPIEADGSAKRAAPAADRSEHQDGRDSMVRKPAWRTRTTRTKRLIASLATVVPCALFGAVLIMLAIGGLGRLDVPFWLATSPWTVLTALSVLIAIRIPTGADPTSDNLDWVAWAVQRVICGETTAYPLVVRVLLATVFGAPLMAGAIVLSVAELLGAF